MSNATAASMPHRSIRSLIVGTSAARSSGSYADRRNSMYWNSTAWHWQKPVSLSFTRLISNPNSLDQRDLRAT